ncbi:MAG: plasmid pRiA4b ORF-3 family protein [Bacillota bacterium]|nr:plasmid pRiA4b ORF-3 family protein [Bacillota bacterium]MDW7682697.1 plasmid pRiA4b ORF-3 family protein [Bacillota bacterium]
MEKSEVYFLLERTVMQCMRQDKLNRLLDKALKLYVEESFVEAESILTGVLGEQDEPRVRIRLAQVRLSADNPQGALDAVLPLLGTDDFLAELMAVRSYLALGREKDVEGQMDKMARMFDRQFAKNKRNPGEELLQQATLFLQQTGMMARHRRVLELYKRWQTYGLDWAARYFAGVASFNLGRFKQAASHWSSIGEIPLALSMQFIAVLVERGTVPPFALEYMFPDPELVEAMMDSFLEEEPEFLPGIVRMAFLAMALDEDVDEEDALETLTPLVLSGEEWGVALGLGLMESSIIAGPVKIAAAQLLVQTGVLPEDRPIPVLVDGEKVMITVSRQEDEEDERFPEYDDLVERLTSRYIEESRLAVEKKKLPPDAGLIRGLRNMPAVWLEAACLFLGLVPERLRKDRERQVEAFLTQPGGLYLTVQKLSETEIKLLRYVLAKGGWARIGVVTRTFGSMEGEAYFWLEEEPKTPLARLWRAALVMVGSTVINDRSARIVTIPANLRKSLQAILDGYVPDELPSMPEPAALTSARDRPAAVDGGGAALQLKITLEETNPPVWRRLVIPVTFTFWELHVAIQDAMGWEDRHLHSFFAIDKNSRKVRIGLPEDDLFGGGGGILPGWEEDIRDYFVRPGTKIRYLYDFGDDWMHTVKLENILPGETDFSGPVCTGGEGACPPEDIGGPYGYRKLLAKNGFDREPFDCRDVTFSDAQQRLEHIRRI